MEVDAEECAHGATIPERLHRNGRPVDRDFAAGEQLYCRCRTNGYNGASADRSFPLIDADGQIHKQHIRTQSQSVTREKHSDLPEDALYDGDRGVCLEDEAIFSFPFGQVGGKRHADPNKKKPHGWYEIRVEHDPTPCIYPHAEVQVVYGDDAVTDDDGRVIESVPPQIKPASVKLWVIDALRAHAVVVRRFPNLAG